MKSPHLWLKLPGHVGSLSVRRRVDVGGEPWGAPRSAVQRGEVVLVGVALADGGPTQTFGGPQLVEEVQARSKISHVGFTGMPEPGDEDEGGEGTGGRHVDVWAAERSSRSLSHRSVVPPARSCD